MKRCIEADTSSGYTKVFHKMVEDYDGFMTDYTGYEKPDGTYGFIFGDNDLYGPEDKNWDFECDTYEEAVEWFDSYPEHQED